MENETPSTAHVDAATWLQGYATVRDRVEHRGPSRAISLLLLWDALAMAVCMVAFLFSFAGRPLYEFPTGASIYSIWMLALPIIVLNSLIGGAKERFGIRKKLTPVYWIAYALLTAACLVLLVTEVTYPWWANLLVPMLLFMAMAASPIRQLRRSGDSAPERWTNRTLSRPARWTTVLIGAAMGLLVIISTQAGSSMVSPAVILLLGFVALFSRSLPRAGAEWGSIHWAAFGIVMSLLFLLTLLLTNTSWVTAPISIATGALALLVMLLAAFLPFPPPEG